MTKTELTELMTLRGWTRTRLAAELHLTDHAVYKWLREGGVPDGPTSILLRIWLEESRVTRTNGKPVLNGKNGHRKRVT